MKRCLGLSNVLFAFVILISRACADNETPEEQYHLGRAHLLGEGLQISETEAAKWFRKAAEKGHAAAQSAIAFAYRIGSGVETDLVEAHMWYGLAAAQGFAQAKTNLAAVEQELTSDQIAESQRRTNAFNARAAGDRGMPSAPQAPPTGDSNTAKFEEIRAKAEKGDAEAQFNLALAYTNGHGVGKSEFESVKWLHKAAYQGLSKAQSHLGLLYLLGKGVAKDEIEGAKWTRKAAEQGAVEAQVTLGGCYVTGCGVNKDEVEAVRLYRLAANQDYDVAQYQLGECYSLGTGVSRDMAQAVIWYRKAAEQNNSTAQLLLASIYSTEYGIPNDYVEARMWYGVFAAQGFNEYSERIQELEKRMSAEQIAEAQRRTVAFVRRKPGELAMAPVPMINQSGASSNIPESAMLTHLKSDERLKSGSVLTDLLQQQGGKGKLTLDNGLAEDACVKLLCNGKLAASFYVRGGERFTFDHIPDETYRVLYCTGFGWDSTRRDFARGRKARRYDDPLIYATTRRTEGTRIITSTAVITLTLHKVPSGNVNASDITLEEFDRY